MTTTRSLPPASLVVTLLNDAIGFWRGGIVVAGLVTIVLVLRWMHVASHIYESRVVISLSSKEPGSPDNSEAAKLRIRGVLSALGQTQDATGTDPSIAPNSVAVRDLPGGLTGVLCRALEPRAAFEHCQGASQTLLRVGGVRVIEPAKIAESPLPAAPSAGPLVVFTSAMSGLLGGLIWMLARALAAKPVQRERVASTYPPRPRHSISYAPPGGPERAEEQLRGARSKGRSEQTALGPVVERGDPGTVLHVPVTTDWEMDLELLRTEPSPDLLTLRDELCVAAAESCFVVGVTALPESAQQKSRLAVQLAWALGETEQARVLLLEVDFTNPRVDNVMQLDMPPLSGFSQQIQAHFGDQPLPWVVMRCTPYLSVLAEGRVRTPGAIYSNEFSTALAQLRNHFDLIIANGPTIGRGVDARAFDDLADGIVFAAASEREAEQTLASASQWFRSRRLVAAVTVRETKRRQAR